MLLNNDLSVLNYNQPIYLKDKRIEQLLYYEKKYNNNSFNIIYSTENDESINLWRNATLEFIRQNGNPRTINTKIPMIYFAITNQTSNKTLEMISFILTYHLNSVVVINNKNPYYEKIISKLNSKGKIVVLMTDSKEDFKMDYSNLIVCYSSNPCMDMINFSDKIMLDINENGNPFPFLKNNEKLLYV